MRVPLAQGQLGGILRLRFKFGGFPSSLIIFYLCQSSTFKEKGVSHYPAVDYDYQY